MDSKVTTSDSDSSQLAVPLRAAVLLGVVLKFDLNRTISSDVDACALGCLTRFGKEKEIRGQGRVDLLSPVHRPFKISCTIRLNYATFFNIQLILCYQIYLRWAKKSNKTVAKYTNTIIKTLGTAQS